MFSFGNHRISQLEEIVEALEELNSSLVVWFPPASCSNSACTCSRWIGDYIAFWGRSSPTETYLSPVPKDRGGRAQLKICPSPKNAVKEK